MQWRSSVPFGSRRRREQGQIAFFVYVSVCLDTLFKPITASVTSIKNDGDSAAPAILPLPCTGLAHRVASPLGYESGKVVQTACCFMYLYLPAHTSTPGTRVLMLLYIAALLVLVHTERVSQLTPATTGSLPFLLSSTRILSWRRGGLDIHARVLFRERDTVCGILSLLSAW